eukprot:gene7925-12393_t
MSKLSWTTTEEEDETDFNLEEFVDDFDLQNFLYKTTTKEEKNILQISKVNTKEKDYLKKKMEFESKFKIEMNIKNTRNSHKSMDPNFFKSDSKFSKMMKAYFNKPRGSVDIHKLSFTETSTKSLPLKEEKTVLKKFRNSVNFSDNVISTIKSKFSPKPKHESPEVGNEVQRQSSVVIDVLKSTDKKEDLSNLFLTTLHEIPFANETEYSFTDFEENNNSSNDLLTHEDGDEEDEEFDHPDILKLMQK